MALNNDPVDVNLRLWHCALALLLGAAPSVGGAQDLVRAAAKRWEAQLGARVGVSVFDTGTQRRWHYRADERFPMASTSKAFVCAALLQQGAALQQQALPIEAADILEYAPVTQHLQGQAPTAAQLCAITLRTSDNTALNKVLALLGGPPAVTAFLRAMGDERTRIDRYEPALNEGRPGDGRDTTTPEAARHTLQQLLLGQVLSPPARQTLTEWLQRNEVGGPLLRAGFPSDWIFADRTGAGGFGTRAAIAVAWPPQGGAPMVMAVYLTDTQASMAERNAAVAGIGQAIYRSVLQARH